MNEIDPNEPQPSCPITPLIEEMLENGSYEDGVELGRHANQCPECFAEGHRALREYKRRHKFDWLKQIGTGLGILVGIGVLFGVKGFNNAVSDACRKKGL